MSPSLSVQAAFPVLRSYRCCNCFQGQTLDSMLVLQPVTEKKRTNDNDAWGPVEMYRLSPKRPLTWKKHPEKQKHKAVTVSGDSLPHRM